MKAWEHFVAVQETELGADVVQKWLRPLKVIKFDAGNLYLEARDPFHAHWFEEHVRRRVEQSLQNNNGRRVRVHVSIKGQENAPVRPGSPSEEGEQQVAEPAPFALTFDELNPQSLLSTLIADPGNELAMRVAEEIIDSNGKGSFNPVYLFGSAGAGKTHLLQGLAHALLAKGINARYVRADTFTQHVVTAIRAGEMRMFRDAYRHSDVLIIDDVHTFSRKKTTQEELFHTFNTLHLAEKQIVLGANGSPQELQEIEPRLVSRFEWGIVVPMQPLPDERKHLLVESKAEQLGLQISEKATEYLLETFTNTVSLSRAIEALALRGHMNHGTRPLNNGVVSIAAARTVLSDLVEAEKRAAITPERIIQAVAEHHGITSDDILSDSKSRERTIPRQQAMFLCKQILKFSYKHIGRVFERDHSTVMSAVRLVNKQLEDHEAEQEATLHAIRKRLESVNP